MQICVVFILAAVAIFVLVRQMPGDPVYLYVSDTDPPATIQAVRESLGLDKPVPVQFFYWVSNVLGGDLGISFTSKTPVVGLIKAALPATIELTVTATVLALAVGVPFGIAAAARRNSWVDGLVTGVSGTVHGIPSFWIGLLLILFFSLHLKVLPASGRVPLTANPGQWFLHVILPAITVSLHLAAELARMTRSSLLDVLHTAYVRTARSKGLKEWAVIYLHALPNALLPIVTTLGLRITSMLGGAVVVEWVFNWPGIGQLLVGAIRNRDLPTIQGALVVFLGVALVITMVTNLSYGLLDPRIRLDGAGKERRAT
jgi:peptide/nickel transport system permease protein